MGNKILTDVESTDEEGDAASPSSTVSLEKSGKSRKLLQQTLEAVRALNNEMSKLSRKVEMLHEEISWLKNQEKKRQNREQYHKRTRKFWSATRYHPYERDDQDDRASGHKRK